MNPTMNTFSYIPKDGNSFSTLALELNRQAEERLKQHIAKPVSGYWNIYSPELKYLNYYHAHCKQMENIDTAIPSQPKLNIKFFQIKLPIQIKLKL
ncbi:MAG: hypothetical protein H7A40_00980 [Chlamydiales bacterium]|nr:hypothetical protein [Chlamydiales bacterium]